MYTAQNLPDFIDNEHYHLSQALDLLLAHEPRADFASGYFNLGGYALLKDALSRAPQFRLLLSREQGKQGGEFYPAGFRQDLARSPFNAQTRVLAHDLIEFLHRPEVQVRLYAKGFFHGKAYIFENVAIVGSSNFTRAGLTDNTELNAVHKQGYAAQAVREWFERFWEEAIDYKQELIALLEESKLVSREYSPYIVFLKSLYELFKDEVTIDLQKGRDLGKSLVNLADFQEKAFERALRILEKHGGVFIADSVGLGKTWVGKKLLEHYGYFQRKKVLVVAPAQLKGMWEAELRSINVAAEVVSMELLGRSEFEVERFFDVDLLLVDESHNFRNSNQRYYNLQRIMASGKRKKAVFLTATPINNSVFDLYNQLMLFTPSEHAFARAGIPHLRHYFIRAQQGGDLLDLLEEVMVRRTRQFIKREYPEAEIDGEPVRFPKRTLKTVYYDLESRFPGIYHRAAQLLEGLSLGVYNVEAYLERPTVSSRLEARRNEALIGLIKTMLLKRFESSVASFRKSVRRQIEFHERFRRELEIYGRILDSRSFRKLLAASENADEVLGRLPAAEASEFRRSLLLQDIERDLLSLQELLELVEHIEVSDDPKVETLVHLLREHADKKIVVFSHFSDTIAYLREALRGVYAHEVASRRWAVVDGSVSPAERAKRIARFAPQAQNANVSEEEELDLLLATDVLSEGQNLQDASMLINYDLHWNPTRMVQRAGRIDRLRSPHDEVFVYNFFPERGLESLLGLLKRLTEKIAAINRNVGLDASILGETIEPKTFNTLERIEKEDETVADELEAEAELSGEFMRSVLAAFLEKVGVERLERMPLGVHSGKKSADRKGVFFHFRVRDQHHWRFYDVERNEVLDSRLAIFRLIKSDEHEPRVDADYDIDELLKRAVAELVETINDQQALVVETLPKLQRDALARLRSLARHPEIEREHLIPLLKALSARPLPRALLRELKGLNETHADDDLGWATAVTAFVHKYDLAPEEEQVGRHDVVSEDEVELVVYMELS